jgi:hypothetical protein
MPTAARSALRFRRRESRATCEMLRQAQRSIDANHFRTQESSNVTLQSKIGLKTIDFFVSVHARCKKLSLVTAPQ